jgi:hypothetical protein
MQWGIFVLRHQCFCFASPVFLFCVTSVFVLRHQCFCFASQVFLFCVTSVFVLRHQNFCFASPVFSVQLVVRWERQPYFPLTGALNSVILFPSRDSRPISYTVSSKVTFFYLFITMITRGAKIRGRQDFFDCFLYCGAFYLWNLSV